jgi:serine/threonine-protein kinase
MALEFVDGRELGEIIHQNNHLTLGEIQPFVADFASALDKAHAQGLVHRDIKPSNIMVRRKADGKTQEAVLMDFGVAKIQDARTSITGTGAIGTIDYMAPEQIAAASEVDHRADIYALGVVLFEMLTGEKPYKGSAPQVLFAHLYQPPSDPREVVPELPAKVAETIMKAMAKKPEERFQTVGALAAALV